MNSKARRDRVLTGLRAAVESSQGQPARFSLTDRMERYGVPGAAITVVNDDMIEWTHFVGTARPDGTRVGNETLFQAASISKAVAAVGILALAEAGDIDLDLDVNEQLRSWRLPASEHTRGQPVTPRHLLSHTGGLTVPGFPGYAHGTVLPNVVDVLSGGGNTPAVESFALPGSTSQYSGGGSTMLQLLVEDVTGRRFGEFMLDVVLTPLGMLDSAYESEPSPDRHVRAAHGHDVNGTPVAGGWHAYPELQAAGLWTTSRDLAHWLIGMQRILRGEKSGPISRQTAEMMVAGLGPFGLGPELGGLGRHRRFGHSGSNEGFRSQVDALIDDSTGAAILTNGAGGTTLIAELRKALADEYGWGPIGPPPIDTVEVDEQILSSLAGRYVGPYGLPMHLVHEGGDLFMPTRYGRRHALAVGQSTFVDEETGAVLQFEFLNGSVQRIAVLAEGSEVMAFTPEIKGG